MTRQTEFVEESSTLHATESRTWSPIEARLSRTRDAGVDMPKATSKLPDSAITRASPSCGSLPTQEVPAGTS